MKEQASEALAGERLASFLPIISELTEKYDAQAIAAAALQLAYDQTRPAWLQNGVDIPVEEPTPKPKINKRRESSDGNGVGRGRSWSKSDYGDEGKPTPKPKLRRREPSVSPSN